MIREVALIDYCMILLIAVLNLSNRLISALSFYMKEMDSCSLVKGVEDTVVYFLDQLINQSL